MPSHDTNVRLRHMLDAAREAAQMVQGKTRRFGYGPPAQPFVGAAAGDRRRSSEPCPG